MSTSELLEVPYAETRVDNYDGDKHTDSCLLCGRGLSESAIKRGTYVEITVDGYLVPLDYELADSEISQGCFPVGSSCKKRVPKNYHLKL